MTESEAIWTRDFSAAALANLVLFTGFQMLLPTLPVYVQRQGGDDFAVGLIIGIFTVTALLVRPFAGQALDALGRGRVLAFGLAVCALSSLGYWAMSTVLLILAVRAVHGIGWGIATTGFGTVAADLIPARRRGEGMGYFGLTGNLAMAVGPAVGIAVMERYGFGPLFVLSTALVVGAIGVSRVIRYPGPSGGGGQLAPSLLRRLVEVRALFPALLVGLMSITFGGVVSFITLFGREVGIANVGLFFTANAVMIMAVRPVAGRVFDRKGHPWVILPGVAVMAAGLLLLSYTRTEWMLAAAACCYGAGFGAIQPSLQAWTINRVAPHRRGAANGTFFSAFDLGISVGAMLLGALAEATSYGRMYRVSIIALGVLMAVYVAYLLRGRRRGALHTG